MISLLRRMIPLCVVLALGAGALVPGAVGAQDDTTITIHLSQCPPGYTGDDPFTDCHSNPISGVTFRWYYDAPMVPEAVVTDSDGMAFIDTKPLGITEEPPFALDYFSVYCTTNDGADEVPIAYLSQTPFGIAFRSGWTTTGNVICDWYNIPLAPTDGNGDTDTPVTLPSTGVTMSHHGSMNSFLLTLAALAAGGFGIGLRQRRVR